MKDYSLTIHADGVEYSVAAPSMAELVGAGSKLLSRLNYLPTVEPASEPVALKRCSGCEVLMPTSQFYPSDRYEDGFDYYCKECRKSTSIKSHKNPNKKRRCAESNCRKPHYAKNLCRNHYAKALRYSMVGKDARVSS